MQWLAALCVRRPIFASVLILLVCVVGIAGYLQLGVDRFPNVDFPVVVVTTTQPGAAPGGRRDRDHRQGRRGGQHDQRHRRAPIGDHRGRLAGRRHVHRREERRRRRAGSARPRQLGAAEPAEGHRSAHRPEARPGRVADPLLRAPVDGPHDPRSDRARGQAAPAHARVGRRRRARCSSSADASAR